MNHKSLITLSLLVAAAGNTFAAYSDNIFSSGHADIGVALEDGTDFHLHFHGHESGPAAVINGAALTVDEEYDAGDLTILVSGATQATAPDNSSFNSGTGVAAGNQLWVLPQGNQAGVPFLGIGTEELTNSDWTTDITFTLDAVNSPSGSGNFSMYQGDGLGGFSFSFSTALGSNTLTAAAGGHDHYSYAFSETGFWEIQLTASGTHNTLGALSDTQTFAFNVVPEPSSYAAILGLAVLGLAFARRRAKS